MESTSNESPTIDIDALRQQLRSAEGKQFWRSLDQLAGTERFQQFLEDEFPQAARSLVEAVDRRQFLKIMSASMALAGVSGCTRQPDEKIIPYVKQPENVVPGEPLYYATAMPLGDDAIGLLVENHVGRPTKIEGNALHPASLGATDAIAQAAVLGLYDPDRSRAVTQAGEIRPWSALAAEIAAIVQRHGANGGEGLRFLTEAVNSPTAASQMRAILEKLPKAKWHRYQPVNRDASRTGSQYAFGEILDSRYRVENADVIFSLDADFLASGPGNVRHAREFATRRRLGAAKTASQAMNRLYVVETTPSLTGSMADHRLPLLPLEIESVTYALARALGLDAPEPKGIEKHAAWIKAAAADLEASKGRALVVPGEYQSPIVHAYAHRINHALGASGATVVYTRPVEADPVLHDDSLRELAGDMAAGKVETLVILGGNPAYDSAADVAFAKHLEKVKTRIHYGSREDETGLLCHWHVPASHFLESWSDTRAFDGTASIIQPLVAPLYDSKTIHEVLALFLGQADATSYDLVRAYWQKETGTDGEAFETQWRRWLHDGIIPDSEFGPQKVALRADWRAHHSEMGRRPTSTRPADRAAAPVPAEVAASASAIPGVGMEILFRPDPTVFDGRYANNAWLQELPKPLTKLAWDNAALLSPATAAEIGVGNDDVVEITYAGRTIEAPVFLFPGQAANAVTLHLGYGRRAGGEVANGRGFDAYALRPSSNPWSGDGAVLRKTGKKYTLVCTQDHQTMEGRNLVRTGTIEEYRKHPHFVHEGQHVADISLYPEHEYNGYSWGMTIDLNACIGCNACMVACQAENNIAVVGKEDVERGREMHWIRLDRYFEGDLDNPRMYHQPVPCMQCENAPCEPVCPANATVHSDEGLNDMVYNRCVGTRYCSNNCPYKVRRFNFRLYTDWNTEQAKLQRNPDVSVRSRGVMEKCTYCVQRINYSRIQAKREGRKIRDGEIVTACQQVCPTEAIVFGDINDPKSLVSLRKADDKNYTLLDDVNTRPRTSYLAALKNPNPKIEQA